MKLIDLTGRRFGKLLVIEKAFKNGKSTYWKCLCDCGIEKDIDGSSLRMGKSNSCGFCSRGIDLTGKVFGRLTVKEKCRDKKYHKNHVWLCDCECGKKNICVPSSSLINGNTQSCGCLWKETIKKDYGESSFNKVLSTYKRVARKKGLIFELEIDFFKELINSKCFYCNSLPSNVQVSRFNNGDYIYNGIDRIDNNKGYVVGNVISCCKRCNVAKNNMSYIDFIQLVKDIYETITKREFNEHRP